MKTKLSLIVVVLVSLSLQAQTNQEADKPVYRIEVKRSGTRIGSFNLELYPLVAPKAVRYFDSLVTIKFFDSTAFHRVIPGFMIQGGDPNSRHGARNTWGYGDPAQETVDAEFSPIPYLRGTLGAARSIDTNSATSQFFVCVASAAHLNGKYTVFGRAQSGLDVVDNIVKSPRDANDNPNEKIEMFITRVGVNDSIPETPRAVFPASEAYNIGSTSTFNCSTISSAVLYEFEVAEDSLFESIVARSTVASPSCTMGDFATGLKRYFWHVRCNNGGRRSAYSSPSAFVSSIAQPQLQKPDSAAVAQKLSVSFSWTAVAGAKSYHLLVATHPLFLFSSIVSNQTELLGTQATVSTLEADKKYYWKVSALAKEYEGAYSASRFFSTNTSTDVEFEDGFTSASSRSIDLFPNPVINRLHIRHLQTLCANSSLSISNAIGERVYMQRNSEQLLATDQLSIDVSQFCSGLYFLDINDGTTLTRQSFVISR